MHMLTLVLLMFPVQTPPGHIIKAGALVMPQSGTVTGARYLHVVDGRINQISEVPLNLDGVAIIDLSSSFVLPGLMDAHTHLCWHINQRKNDGYVLSIVREPTAYRAIQGVANARDMLNSGFTTVRDVGNAANYADTALRLAVEDGLVPGPTIINAGRLISPFGGQRWVTPERRNYTQPEYFFADTRDELLKAIRENIHFGALLIKLIVDDQKYIYSQADIRFVVEQAALADMKVAAHCATEQGAINAINAGVASIEHGFSMTAEAMKLAAAKGIPLVTTTFSLPVLQSMASDLSHAPEDDYQAGVATLKLAYQHGVTVAFGSDVIGKLQGHDRGQATLTYIKSFQDAAVPPLEILRAMTTNAARVIGVDHERGAIKQGYHADLIAVEQNPINHIDTLKKVHFVMKEGHIIRSR